MRKALSVNQCIDLLEVISARGTKRAMGVDKALVISVLLSGSEARQWTWKYFLENLSDAPYAVFDAIRMLALSRRLVVAPFNSIGFHADKWGSNTAVDSPIFSVSKTPLTTQEITRRLKRYGRFCGIAEADANLRTLNNTHRMLMRTYGDPEAVAYALGLPTIWDRPSRDQFSQPSTRDPRLHGIGRRNGL